MGPAPVTSNYSAALEDALDNMYHQSQKPNRHTVSRLFDLIKKYPRIPQFKNYLHAAYTVLGEKQKAKEITHLTVREHPDYFFGKIALAQDYLDDDSWDKVPEVFGGEIFEIEQLLPGRPWYHISEVMAINSIACQYYIYKKELWMAEAYIDLMNVIDPEHRAVDMMTKKLMLARLSVFSDRHKKEKALERRVETIPRVRFEPSDQSPVFHHSEIEELYRHDLSIPQEVVQKILALPRPTLLLDLRKCLIDAVQRFDWFCDTYEDFNEAEQDFPIHALYLLAELGDSSALPDVLNLLRQDEGLLDYWFSEQFTDYFWEPIYQLSQHALPDLKAFLLEENVYCWSKTAVAEAVTQMALHDPAWRKEVLDWFRVVFRGFLAQPDNDNMIDTTALSWIVAQAIHLRAAELLPEIRDLYEQQWIMPSIIGELEEVEQDMQKPLNPFHTRPLPRNIAERYSGEHEKRRARSNEIDADQVPGMLHSGARELKIMAELLGGKKEMDTATSAKTLPDAGTPPLPENNLSQTAWPGGKNISRNDLCPCGSGKKFKRCHGK